MVRLDPGGRNAPVSPAPLAAFHVHFYARRALASADQHADAVDVWPRLGTGVGEAPLREFLSPLRSGRGLDRSARKDDSDFLWAAAVSDADDRSFRGDLRHPDGQCRVVPGPADLADSTADHDSDAAICRGHGSD